MFDFSKSLDYRPSRQSQDSIVVCGVTLTDPLSRTKSDTSENLKKIIYYPLFRMLKEDSVSNLTQKNASSTPNLNVLNGTAASYFANLDKSVNWKGLRQSRSMESLTTSPNMSLTHSFDDGKYCYLLTGAVNCPIVESKARRKTFKEVIQVINKSKRVIKTITFMLGENSRADDDKERKRYKSPPPPVATADDDDDIEDELLEEEKKEPCTEQQEMKVPKLVHSVSSFFLVKNQTNDIMDCPPSPKKTKSNTTTEETIINTQKEIKHLGRTSRERYNQTALFYSHLLSCLDAISLEVELELFDDEMDEEDEDVMILTSRLRPLVRKDTSICMVAPPDFRLTPYKKRKTGFTRLAVT